MNVLQMHFDKVAPGRGFHRRFGQFPSSVPPRRTPDCDAVGALSFLTGLPALGTMNTASKRSNDEPKEPRVSRGKTYHASRGAPVLPVLCCRLACCCYPLHSIRLLEGDR